VRRNLDFQAMRQQGRRVDCGAFVFAWRTRPPTETGRPGPARVGVVASRASVGDAVERNRAKRRLREIFRKHQGLVPAGIDLVLTSRGSILRAPFADLEQRFTTACGKLPGAVS
jgi:ribonuclease P protein component